MKKASLLLLVLALAVPASPAQGKDEPIKSLLRAQFAAWSTLNVDAPKKFYTDDPKAVYFDVAPLKYTGWQEYRDGVAKVFVPNYSSLKIEFNDDIVVHHAGGWAWATATWKGDGVQKSGKKDHFEGRYTGVLKKEGKNWKIVHEHVSVPLS